jgi:hypothetical protein
VPATLCAGVAAIVVAAGCGSDDESTAREEPAKASAAGEPARAFIMRMAKLLETTTKKKDCAELEQINARSVARFSCPAPKDLRKSMRRFEVVGVEEYGTGAIVDYKSGAVKDGAAIVLFVAPDRGWGVGRFGILSEPSTESSDEGNRDGYRKAVDEFLTAIRSRDCDTYVAVAFNGDDKKDVVCRETFPRTRPMAKALKANPDAEPRYEGGNDSYGFYSLELLKPKPTSFTISIAKATAKGPRPNVVLDATAGPSDARDKAVRKALERSRKKGKPGQPETSPSRKADPPPAETS